MTNKIEETKHDMYQLLASVKSSLNRGFAPISSLKNFEDAMEAHLEELWLEIVGLGNESDAMREERDEIQGRLHAIDNAYSNQCSLVQRQAADIERLKVAAQVAGDELRDAKRKLSDLQAKTEAQHAIIVSQREGYGQLFMENAALTKRVASVSCDKAKSSPDSGAVIFEALVEAQGVMSEWIVPEGISAKKAMSRMTEILDNEKLINAMGQERAK